MRTWLAALLAISTSAGTTGCSRDAEGPEVEQLGPAALQSGSADTPDFRRVRAEGQLGPGRGTLIIMLEAPPGSKLTEGAPLRVRASGEHLRFPEPLRMSLNSRKLPLRLPVDVVDGATGPARVELSYYWCRGGERGACRPERAQLDVALDLTGDGPGGEAFFTYRPRPN